MFQGFGIVLVPSHFIHNDPATQKYIARFVSSKVSYIRAYILAYKLICIQKYGKKYLAKTD